MARYWVCTDSDCPEFDGALNEGRPYTADRADLAMCPTCKRQMTALGGDVDPEHAAMVARWDDYGLGKAWVANELGGEDNSAVEAEIRRRHGAVNFMDWCERLLERPSGRDRPTSEKVMGYQRGLYDD